MTGLATSISAMMIATMRWLMRWRLHELLLVAIAQARLAHETRNYDGLRKLERAFHYSRANV